MKYLLYTPVKVISSYNKYKGLVGMVEHVEVPFYRVSFTTHEIAWFHETEINYFRINNTIITVETKARQPHSIDDESLVGDSPFKQ